jgi:hypothetical protein
MVEFVTVTVPVPLYSTVIRLIADYQGPAPPSSAVTPPSSPPAIAAAVVHVAGLPVASQEKRPRIRWSEADYADLKPHLNQFSRLVLDLCAKTPAKWVTYEDAVKESGFETASARSQLGGLTRKIDKRFPDHVDANGDTLWPFECDSTPDRQLRFRLREEAALNWKAVAEDEND